MMYDVASGIEFSTFVVGLDKRDPNGEGYEAPMWDGYYTYTDSITGEEITTYSVDDDLQSKIDLFVNPIYYFGGSFYGDISGE